MYFFARLDYIGWVTIGFVNCNLFRLVVLKIFMDRIWKSWREATFVKQALKTILLNTFSNSNSRLISFFCFLDDDDP